MRPYYRIRAADQSPGKTVMTTPAAQLVPARGADWPWLESAAQMAWRACRQWPGGPASNGHGWTAAPRVATRSPAPTLASIGTARAFTLATLARWGISDAAGDAAAVMSELLTNALRHALPHAGTLAGQVSAWPIRLGLLQPGPCVVCAVAAPSPQPPVLRHPSWEEESGRGLQVVASLASQWGYCADPGGRGKVVWAAFATASRPG